MKTSKKKVPDHDMRRWGKIFTPKQIAAFLDISEDEVLKILRRLGITPITGNEKNGDSGVEPPAERLKPKHSGPAQKKDDPEM